MGNTLSNTCKRSYLRPTTIGEALELIENPGACVLAGGTDLIIMRAQGMVKVDYLVDLKHIEGLSGVSTDNGETRIGAATCLEDLISDAGFSTNAVTDGAVLVGGWQTRSRATIGGNICRASPGADTLCGLIVLGAKFVLISSSGQRTVDAANFFTGPGKTLLQPDEILQQIILPEGSGGSAYARFTYRNAMDLAVAGVAVFLEIRDGLCIDASVAIAACGPTPLLVPDAARVLIGSAVDEAAIDAASHAVVSAAQPIDDVRGTRWHRLRVLPSLTRQVIIVAYKRGVDAKSEVLS
ncbi:MAG TPA: xanthine dehydrogenase family protein subunit M [Gammaproteobacteria bacterium]|nr:xanthine dehydrogenase family protein subunit M [Gammaproteobacteria bacterium]HIM04467.1 xanthine dehydrogenase family protein subunit M [Gammaproteobacteria bacterium]